LRQLPIHADPLQLLPRQQEREMLAAIVENSDDAIFSKRLDGTILSWNKGAEQLFGYDRKEMVGKLIMKIVPPDRVREEKDILRRLKRGERIDHYETPRLTKGGSTIVVSISITPIRDARGRITGAATIVRDMSHRDQAEAQIRDSEQRIRAILDTAADAIITIDQRGIIQSVNAATEKLFGYQSNELIGQNVKLLMPEPFHGEHDQYLRNYVHTGHAKIIGIGREVTARKKDGTMFPIHLAVGEVRVGQQRLFTGIVHDLSERRRLERQILEATTNEQRRIGQDLHDGLCQDLVGIAFSIDSVTRGLPAEAASAVKAMSALSISVRQAAAQARDLSHGLNPVDVRAGGLPAALQNLALKVSHSFGVRCEFDWDETAHVSDDAAATHLYRIAQEAASNGIKHGKARKIEISLFARDQALVLSVSDNGKGIPKPLAEHVKQGRLALANRVELKHTGEGIGLQTMRYRARVIGGNFLVGPRPGGGTIITCTLRQQVNLTAANSPNSHGPSEKAARSKRLRSR
jgi:PAS domain S-box-containing protein